MFTHEVWRNHPNLTNAFQLVLKPLRLWLHLYTFMTLRYLTSFWALWLMARNPRKKFGTHTVPMWYRSYLHRLGTIRNWAMLRFIGWTISLLNNNCYCWWLRNPAKQPGMCIKPCKWRKLYLSSRSSSIKSIFIQYIAAFFREWLFSIRSERGILLRESLVTPITSCCFFWCFFESKLVRVKCSKIFKI